MNIDQEPVFFPLTVTEMSVNGNRSNTLTLTVIVTEIPEKNGNVIETEIQ